MNRSLFSSLLVFALAAIVLPVQAELIEIENAPRQVVAPVPVDAQQDASKQFGELFYQMQVLQQEVMLLRGQVEDQSRQLDQVKQQNLNRIVDLDRRVSFEAVIVQRPH